MAAAQGFEPSDGGYRDMIRIVDLGEMATGDSLEDQGVRMAAGSAWPQRHPQPAGSLSTTNGHRPVVGSATH